MPNSFDLMAESFDTDSRKKRANTIVEKICQEIDQTRKMNTLEFGCGTGLITIDIVNKLKNITLVDSSEGMLTQLKVKLSTIHTTKQIDIYTDIFSKSILPYSYDLIYSSMVLHHIKDIELFGNRLNELLAENGTLCIIDLYPVDQDYHKNESDFDGHHGFDPVLLTNQLEYVGFEKEKCNKIYSGSKKINDKIVDYSLFMLLMKKIK